MTNGIIISTQTNIEMGIFTTGNTGKALSKATGFPVIYMHRDAEPRVEEINHLEQVGNGSVVFITGHSEENADSLNGIYYNPDEMDDPIIASWQLEQYSKLILGNSRLQAGDHFTLVLWACAAGKGGMDSIAYKLGEHFTKAGVKTRIICSEANIERFDRKPGEVDLKGDSLRLRVYHVNELRIFDNGPLGSTVWQNASHIYFNQLGIQGYDLQNPQRMGYPLEILTHKRFHPELKTASEAANFLRIHPKIPRVIRPSNEKSSDSVFFAITYRANKKIVHDRFKLDLDYKFYLSSPNEKPKQLNISPTGEILPAMYKRIKQVQKAELHNGEQSQSVKNKVTSQ